MYKVDDAVRRRVRETQQIINQAFTGSGAGQQRQAAGGIASMFRTLEQGRQQFVQSQIAAAEQAAQGSVNATIRAGQGMQQAERARFREFERSIQAIDRAEQRRLAEAQRADRARVASARQTERAREAATREAHRDIARMERERGAIMAQVSRASEQLARHEANARIREARRAAREIERILRGAQTGGAGGGGGRGQQGGGGAFFGGSLAGFAGAGPFVSAIGVGLGLTIFSVTARLKEGAAAWVDYASKIENARIAFTTMLGSIQLADAHLRELQQFALTTPFAFDELVDASQRMQALGFGASEIVPVLRDVGNAVAAAGGGGERLDRVIKALSDVRAKEKLQTQEVRQFAEAGISVYKMLQEETGKSVVEIQKMIEAGEITSTVFENAFRKFSQAHFGDLMQQQSKTFTGAMSNIRDVLLQTASTAFEPYFKKLSELAVRTQDELQKLDNQDLADVMVRVAEGLAEVFVEALVTHMARQFANPRTWLRAIPVTNIIPILRGIVGGIDEAIFSAELAEQRAIAERGKPPAAPAIRGGAFGGSALAVSTINEKALAAQSEKAVTILKGLERQLILTGEASREMATRQKLLAEGISDVTKGAAAEAIELARAQDKLLQLLAAAERRSDFTVRAAELEADRNFRIRKSLDDLLDPVGQVSQQLADLRAEEAGGRSEVEKFNAVLGLQAQTFLGMAEHELELYRAKLAEIDRQQAENTIARRIRELSAEAFRLRESVDGNLPPLKEFELWLRENAQAAKLGKDKLDALRTTFEELAAATDADKIKRERQALAKSLTDLGRDLDAAFQRRPDDAISKLAEDLQKLAFLKIQPQGFEEFIERLRGGSLDAQTATSLIATSIAGAAGDIGPEFDKVVQQITNMFLKSRELADFLAREDATAKYAQMVAELSLVLETDAAKTHSTRLAKELLKDSYKALTDAQREHLQQLAAEADAAERAREAQERRLRQLQDIAQDLGAIFSDITDSIGQGTEKFFDTVRRELTSLARDIKEQLFTGLFEGLLTGMARPGTGIGGTIADMILGGLGIQIGDQQQVVVADNTKATQDNTAALNANTRAQGGVGTLPTAGIPVVGDILGPFLNLLPKRAMGGSVSAGNIFRVNDRFTGRKVELFQPNMSGQILSLGQENALQQMGSQPTVVESRTIVAVGDKAINKAQESYGRSRDGRRAQLVNARWHRKVLSFA